jgi:hypothetical protein
MSAVEDFRLELSLKGAECSDILLSFVPAHLIDLRLFLDDKGSYFVFLSFVHSMLYFLICFLVK